jgi:hypothetical protein
MFGIDQGLRVVSLHDAVRRRHLDRFVVHRIALDFFAVAAALGFPILEKFIEPLDLQLEAAFALLLTFDLDFEDVCLPAHVLPSRAEFFLQLIAFVFEFLDCAAPFFRDIRGEFDAIQRKVRAAQQIQFVADRENIAEDGRVSRFCMEDTKAAIVLWSGA